MNRQPLTLDTSQRPRYSYIATPVELNGPQQHQQYQQQHQQEIQQPTQDSAPSESLPATNVATQELEQARQIQLHERQVANATPHQGLPVHPALSAPYAEEPAAPINSPPPPITSPQYSFNSPPPPSSPGPLPVKGDHPRPPPTPLMPIVPDINPLQSPLSPSFPPTAKHHPQHMQSNNSNNNNNDESYTTHLPGQIAHPNQMTTGGGWSTGLCECSDIGTCCLGLTCPCILYGRTQYRLLRKSRGEDPTNMLGYETCNGSCTAMALFCGCQWILATIQHTRTRRAYRIEGDICSDCARATCCPCCTCIRNEREIRLREDARAQSAQLNGANFVSPYLPPGQMQYRAG
ncbi:uncharacterized protein TRUGW13939_05442 [Talaromyces rugulosus]|uniref:DUF614 domain protein n=1 Tax=Talaromyces rugulosus TaxID=121627 RepID=A0A7H8QW97_TALRU|nr:uncharacterized protein TRUGW13939_05442 [Talaromyces rugulosus]QKX58320.1 hypothetical protein TRUGW13939_05442 [Talaromyces rugulosus]